MADYYTNFSVALPLPNHEAQQYALDLAEKVEQGSEDLPESLKEVMEDWCFETVAQDENNIWLHSSNGGVDAVCAFIQHLLQRYNPAGCVAVEWSFDCSKPRIGAFGGGAAIVTAADIISMTTREWVETQIAERCQSHME